MHSNPRVIAQSTTIGKRECEPNNYRFETGSRNVIVDVREAIPRPPVEAGRRVIDCDDAVGVGAETGSEGGEESVVMEIESRIKSVRDGTELSSGRRTDGRGWRRLVVSSRGTEG